MPQTEQPIYFKTGDFCRLKYDTLLRDGYNRIPANTIVYIEAKCNTSDGVFYQGSVTEGGQTYGFQGIPADSVEAAAK